ncbi:MAG: putative metallopeptidase, partial [Pyrinomonadaceae bacterium]
PELLSWSRHTFFDTASRLYNADHHHLRQAHIGFLWTNVPNAKAMRTILATAEMPMPRGSRWQRERELFQLSEWFGDKPDFLITVYAPFAARADHATWCALIEHELYHCAQARNKMGALRFSTETGKPIWAMRGHDVEEFTGVLRRYGARAAGVLDFVAAARKRPLIARADIRGACGTCLARAA